MLTQILNKKTKFKINLFVYKRLSFSLSKTNVVIVSKRVINFVGKSYIFVNLYICNRLTPIRRPTTRTKVPKILYNFTNNSVKSIHNKKKLTSNNTKWQRTINFIVNRLQHGSSIIAQKK